METIRTTNPGRQLRISIALIVLLVLAGTAGFYLIGEQHTLFESLYLTVIILTTVGMEAAQENERPVALLLMIAGIFTTIYAAGTVVAFIIDGDLRALLGRRQLNHTLDHLRNHIIVVGYGRMGRRLCIDLREAGVEFVLVERDQDKITSVDELGYLYVNGDAMEEQILKRAGLERARGLASCLPRDEHNVFVTLTARGIRPHMQIVARAEDPRTEEKLTRAGASRVICAPELGASRIMEMLIKPTISDIIPADSAEKSDLDVCRFSVNKLPGLIGQTIGSSHVLEKTGMMVAAIDRNGTRTFNPSADTQLDAQCDLIVIGPDGGRQKMMNTYA